MIKIVNKKYKKLSYFKIDRYLIQKLKKYLK